MSVFRSNLKEAYRSLVTARQRTILAVIGIVIGIGSVIGMVSIGEIVRHEALRQFMDMGIDVIVVSKSFRGDPGSSAFKQAAVVDLPSRSLGVVEVAPYANSSDALQIGGQTRYFQLFGVTSAFFSINKLALDHGRAIRDFDARAQFCVVGAGTASYLRSGGVRELLGHKLTLGDRLYTVIGVMDRVADGGGMRPGGLNEAILVPLGAAMKLWPSGDINQFLARIEPGRDLRLLRSGLERYFEKTCGGLKIELRTAEEMIASMEKQMALYTLLLGAIGSIALIVGGIGVMNVMLISVSERRSEIGVRRALGAQKGDIQLQFILESVALCLVGGFLGILTGVGVSYVFARVSHYGFGISVVAIVLGVAVSTVVGLFFGYYPARKAASLDPITALRSVG